MDRIGKVEIASSSSIDAGSYFFSANPSPLRQRRQLGGADPLDQAIEMLADPRFGPRAVGRLEQHVQRPVELAPGRFEVAELQFRWPASKCRSRVR